MDRYANSGDFLISFQVSTPPTETARTSPRALGQPPSHPAEGTRIAGPLLEWLGPWAGAIAEHHERFDGKGYPKGVAEAGISVAGRVVAVADAYDTMTAARSYKKPMAIVIPAKGLPVPFARTVPWMGQFGPAT